MQKRKLGDEKTRSLIECVEAELISIKRTLAKVSYYLERVLVQSVTWSLAEFRHNKIMQSPDENYFNVCRQHKEK